MELLILARAESEVLEIQARLADISQSLGDRFSERIEAALDRIAGFPHAALHGHGRRPQGHSDISGYRRCSRLIPIRVRLCEVPPREP